MAYDIKTMCLGALSLGEATGYEIRKQFEEGPFAYFFDASFGSIYPALNRLLDEGLATCRSESQPGRPTKKIYSLTEAGRDELRAALEQGPSEHKLRSDFLAALFFGHLTGRDARAKAYDAYCDFYRNVLVRLGSDNEGIEPFGHKLVHGFGIHVYRAALDYLEAHRDEFVNGEGELQLNRYAIGGE